MKSQFTVGQIIRYKKQRRSLLEEDFYFVVLGFKGQSLWIQVLNTNPQYKAGCCIIPESKDDFEPIEIYGYHFINSEVLLYESYTDEIVIGAITFVEDVDNPITFYRSKNGLESNVTFGMGDDSYPTLQGKLVVEFPDVFYA